MVGVFLDDVVSGNIVNGDIGHVHMIILFNRETRNMIATLTDRSPFGRPDSQPVVSA